MHVTLCNSYTPILDFYSNTTTVKDFSGTVQGKIYELYEGHSNIYQLYDFSRKCSKYMKYKRCRRSVFKYGLILSKHSSMVMFYLYLQYFHIQCNCC